MEGRKVCEVEIYACGGARIDGEWSGARELEQNIKFFRLLGRPFVFRKFGENVPDEVVEQVIRMFGGR